MRLSEQQASMPSGEPHPQDARTLVLPGATPAEALHLLAARVGHLATADAEGRPHVVPVCFAVASHCIYTPLDEKPKRVSVDRLRRVQNILANPTVCLVVDRYSEDWSELAWLQVHATASILAAGNAEHEAAVAALRRRYWQYANMRLENRPVIRLFPVRYVSWGL